MLGEATSSIWQAVFHAEYQCGQRISGELLKKYEFASLS